MFYLDRKCFLDTVCSQIKYKPARAKVAEELKNHIEEAKEEFVQEGWKLEEAEAKAVSQMGDAEAIGKKLNKIHRPKLDWKLLLLVIILIGFGLVVAILQQSADSSNRIQHTAIYMLIGIVFCMGMYFFDYRKMQKYANLLYLLATILMVLPYLGLANMVNGVNQVRIGSISFMPCTITVPLYLIAFIGYLTNYQKEKVIKIQIDEKEIHLNKDFIKITVLTILSFVLIFNVPSITNAAILFFSYLVILTVKVVQEKETRVKNLAIIYGSLFVFLIIPMICTIFTSPYRFERLICSFVPEMDPQGSGYTGMLQKEILENAKWIGEADTDIITNDNYIISLDSNYTFIYLIGKTGILASGILVLTILLISIKLILNAKTIKDPYGKMLIIGLSTLYISQSLASVLMNVNLGIKAGINLPIVSLGGVYFIFNMISIGILLSVYRRKDINLYEKREKIEGEEKVG